MCQLQGPEIIFERGLENFAPADVFHFFRLQHSRSRLQVFPGTVIGIKLFPVEN